MLDLVFIVEDANSWHAENVKNNKHHYSFLHHLGSKRISKIQRLPACVYYNTFVQIGDQVRIINVCVYLLLHTEHAAIARLQ